MQRVPRAHRQVHRPAVVAQQEELHLPSTDGRFAWSQLSTQIEFRARPLGRQALDQRAFVRCADKHEGIPPAVAAAATRSARSQRASPQSFAATREPGATADERHARQAVRPAMGGLRFSAALRRKSQPGRLEVHPDFGSEQCVPDVRPRIRARPFRDRRCIHAALALHAARRRCCECPQLRRTAGRGRPVVRVVRGVRCTRSARGFSWRSWRASAKESRRLPPPAREIRGSRGSSPVPCRRLSTEDWRVRVHGVGQQNAPLTGRSSGQLHGSRAGRPRYRQCCRS